MALSQRNTIILHVFIIHYHIDSVKCFFKKIKMFFGSDFMPSFSERLKELRKYREETQKYVSQNINIAERNYIELEKGKFSPRVETLIKLCKYFDVSSDYLLGLSDIKERR